MNQCCLCPFLITLWFYLMYQQKKGFAFNGSECCHYLIFKVCTFDIIYCILQFGHNDYKDPMTVLDSDDELVLLNGDPTDFYLFEVLCDIMDCTGTYFG